LRAIIEAFFLRRLQADVRQVGLESA